MLSQNYLDIHNKLNNKPKFTTKKAESAQVAKPKAICQFSMRYEPNVVSEAILS